MAAVADGRRIASGRLRSGGRRDLVGGLVQLLLAAPLLAPRARNDTIPVAVCASTLAQYRARQASGETTGVPHEQVRAQLGLGHAS
ncbi:MULTISPECIES: hypothetical protein [Streptomyces]|uniref:hypothetical protein n=1 Tax=Streptomyces lycopersici TaxID=2974589 RepID=UPI0021D2B5F2|nr:hypothetical protein [Streptomyces sp. NEAU-383]